MVPPLLRSAMSEAFDIQAPPWSNSGAVLHISNSVRIARDEPFPARLPPPASPQEACQFAMWRSDSPSGALSASKRSVHVPDRARIRLRSHGIRPGGEAHWQSSAREPSSACHLPSLTGTPQSISTAEVDNISQWLAIEQSCRVFEHKVQRHWNIVFRVI